MPSTEVTCQECHSIDRINTPGNPIKLILRPRYETDEANTMQQVAVAIRPTGLGSTRSAVPDTEQVDTSSGESTVLDPRGVHWHVAEPVAVYATDEQGQTIPAGRVHERGRRDRELHLGERDRPGQQRDARHRAAEVEAPRAHDELHRLPQHGRAQHPRSRAVSWTSRCRPGAISPSLPYIKRDGLALLNRSFETEEQANQAIDAFGVAYAAEHPEVAAENPGAVIVGGRRAATDLQRDRRRRP